MVRRVFEVSSDNARLLEELKFVGVDPYAYKMVQKGVIKNILIKDISSPAANILKQEALAASMDAAVSRGVVACKEEKTDVLLMGTLHNYEKLLYKLSLEPYGLKEVAKEVQKLLDDKGARSFSSKGKRYDLSTPFVMGICNVTPDSFYDGGKYFDKESAFKRIDFLIEQGVEIIDIGAASSNPNSKRVASKEEIKRLNLALDYALSKRNESGFLISIDTDNEEVIRYALEKGADIINSVSSYLSDDIVKSCAESKVGLVLMHMLGTPQNMQTLTNYKNLIEDIKDYFNKELDRYISLGMQAESIILDLGYGFAKDLESNYKLLKYQKEFCSYGMPILAGLSRKSMLYKVLEKGAEDALIATAGANMAALMNGADILRVHDVIEARDIIKIYTHLK